MRYIRFVTAALAAGALIVAAGCRSTSTTTTTTTSTPATVASTDNSYGTTSSTSGAYSGTTSSTSSNTTTSTTTNTTSLADNSGSTSLTTTTTPTTTTNADGSTTTVLPNGNTVTRATTTTVVYPNGTVQSMPSDGSTTVSTANGTVPAVPPGAAIVTKTVTTIETKPGTQQIAQTVPQPIYITTTPANIYSQQPPMTSSTTSSTSIYQPYRSGRGRRFPGFNLLVFADRASFSNNNSSLNGTVNTGQFGSDIRNENGWGGGINMYLGRTNFSTEFTYSNIQPRATLTPTNTAFQPITNLRFKMQPITGALQLHFNPRSSVDAYIGGGGAYVMFKPSNSFNAGNTGLTAIRFKDEWGPLVNAGIGFGFSPNFGLNFDAKYMWVRANATPTFGDAVIGNVGNRSRLGVNPFIVSAGLRFGF